MNIFKRLFTPKKRRVIQILDAYDTIPSSGRYLYSVVRTFPMEETEEQRAQRVIHGTEPAVAQLQAHYYEVSQSDYIKLIKEGFATKSMQQKINELLLDIKKHDKTRSGNQFNNR